MSIHPIDMASQRLTIAKIAGAASSAALDLFRRWRSERLVDDPSEWSAEQWPKHVRQHADKWALNLRQNGIKPPILFFAEYVDLWSFCPPDRHVARQVNNDAMIQMVADQYELFCLPLPISQELATYLDDLRANGQW